jgi:phage gp36-like protein
MTYATQQDMIERFGTPELAQLTDPAAGIAIDETIVARALGDADAEIDARLAPRYALPLAVVPTVLVRIASDLARYFLWDARASEAVRNRAQEARRLLDAIAGGDVSLGGATPLPPAAGAVAVSVLAPARQFSAAQLDAFAPRG